MMLEPDRLDWTVEPWFNVVDAARAGIAEAAKEKARREAASNPEPV